MELLENAAFLVGVLVCSVCYNKHYDWVAYKLQKFISYCCGGWGFQDHGASKFDVRDLFLAHR